MQQPNLTQSIQSSDAINVSKELWTISPQPKSVLLRLQEVWAWRRLFRFFATNAVSRIYQRTIFGQLWLFVRPGMTVIPQLLFFVFIMQAKTPGTPYLLFALAGLLPWLLFEHGWLWATRSLEVNRNLLRKLFFPRLILPIAYLAPALVYFGVVAVVFTVAVAWFSFKTGVLQINLASGQWVIVGLSLVLLLSLGFGLVTSVWGAFYRDVRFTMRYVAHFLLLITPVAYGPDHLSAKTRWLLTANPLAHPVMMVRHGLLGTPYDPCGVWVSITVAVLSVLIGLAYFLHSESTAVDRI